MIEKIMTKDTEKLLCLLYKMYLDNRDKNQSKYQAVAFDGYHSMSEDIHKNIDEDEFDYGLHELSNLDFIRRYVDGGFLLKPDAIIFMENRFGKTVSEVIDTITKFIP